jgi:hypothetical protein
METRLYRGTLLALYQLSLILGIALLPIALAARQVGVELPIHRMITRLGDAYENVDSDAR